MSKLSRLLIAASALLMSTTLFAPLWFIELFAPQYPEGLGMQIWANKITGDVDNINILNHYIGMKHIIPNEIPELTILTPLFLVIVISGLLTAIIGNKIIMRLWVGFFLVSGAVAFADFYRWEYNYGHDLNPDAPIKVPGMHYQPPLIGSKTLLNISAYSYPDIAGVCVFFAIAFAILALFDKRLLKMPAFKGLASMALVSFFLSLTACESKPEPIIYGKDSCAFCRMTVSESKFGAELITKSGKVFKFDSIGCMIGMYKTKSDEVEKVLISDFFQKESLIDAKDAIYFKSTNIHGPMGTSVLATVSKTELDKYKQYLNSEWANQKNSKENINNDSKDKDKGKDKNSKTSASAKSESVSDADFKEFVGQELKWQELVDSY